MLLDDTPFADPTSLFIQPDHYVTRLLHAGGVGLDRLGVGEGPLPEDRARAAWRLLCANWHLLRGTPVRYWFDSELAEIFGVTRAAERRQRRRAVRPDRRAAAQPGLPARGRCCGGSASRCWPPPTTRPTTSPRTPRSRDDPASRTRVTPTFRPDRYLEPARPGWARRGQAARRGRGHRRRRLRRLRRGAGAAPRGTSSRTARCPPITATPTRRRTARARRGRTDLPAGADRARVRGRGDRVPTAHDASRWPGCPATTGWS